MAFSIYVPAWKNMERIPGKYAFGVPADEGHIALSDNMNPEIRWSEAPADTKSFAIICHDPDVPSLHDNVNQEGKIIPADLARIDFYHWVVVDIPASISVIAEGADSAGVTAKGKPPGQQSYGVTGINSYTDWFSGDADMGGNYGGYDGPCPPWNDSILHHYHFTVYALSVDSLGLKETFSGVDALGALSGHVLAQASHIGVYSLNLDL